MTSKEILKKALIKYDGTLILVSHDRYFLDGLVTKIFDFRNNKVRENLGGIYDFLRKKKIENLNELNIKAKQAANSSKSPSENKLNYEAKKELEKQIRKTSNKIKSCETKIEKLEKEIEQFNNNLQNPESSDIDLNNSNLFVNYEALKKDLDSELRNWERYSYELEILIEKRD